MLFICVVVGFYSVSSSHLLLAIVLCCAMLTHM